MPTMHQFLVLFEKTNTGFCCYAPDMPGCIAAGETMEETEKLMSEAMGLHIKGMLEDGDPIPTPTHVAAKMLEVREPKDK